MKMKSTLWALAFACAAVSCSDDMDNPNKGGNDNELQGQSAYMKVIVNSEITTRANPTGGEEGDGEDEGSPEESNVKDVTVILYKASGQDDDKYNFVGAGNEIIAAGWAENTDGMTSGTVDKHDWKATVKLSFTDQAEDWNGKTFGIIAVTNLGEDNGLLEAINGGLPTITKGDQLADYLQTTYKTGNNFVMSTHTTTWNNVATTIKLDANANADNAPEAEVFVERLAAKVRINQGETTDNHLGNFVYALDDDRVVLNDAAVVNQLTSGSYLLKRVTEGTTITGTIEYLGDESSSVNGGTNYVIDPWTTAKTSGNVEDQSSIESGGVHLNYAIPFKGASYNGLWASVLNTQPTDYKNVSLHNNAARTSPLLLCYTMENTTSADNSLNGYSTGALFRAIYYPNEWTAVTDNDNTGSVSVEYGSGDTKGTASTMVTPNATTLPQGRTFYVYNQTIYENYDAILAEFLNAALGKTLQPEDLTISKFNSSNIKSLKFEDFQKSKVFNVKDEFGYIDYLKKVIEEASETQTTFEEADSFEEFQENATFNKTNVREYTFGVCYYPYWIRHANNGKPAEMGVMEFGIVRNNIYDLTVSQISQLGLSGSDVPDPKDPDEDGDARMVVNIHVKNWVVRNNGGIIL